ncbi:FERM domain-containing protein 4B-like isoform X2 [Tachypleus tridentatus]|uniref:FERM domain-containing protein 4B-like isoform X2 n=1 Tax=Tachypleus tridentatus TaxID=6853 RepID=UPI003FD49190
MTLQRSKGYNVGEGRQSQVVLLDGRRLDILIQPKLYTAELLDMVSSHLNLKEKRIFWVGIY